MHCANCGGDHPDLNFCPSCGVPLAPADGGGGGGIGVGSVVVLVSSLLTGIFLFIQTHPRVSMPFRLPGFLGERRPEPAATAVRDDVPVEPAPAAPAVPITPYVLVGRTTYTSGSARVDSIALQLAPGRDWRELEPNLLADLRRSGEEPGAVVVRFEVYDADTPATVREAPAVTYVWYDTATAPEYPDPETDGFEKLTERIYRKA